MHRHLIRISFGLYPSPNPKRSLDRFSRFCTAHCRASLYFGSPYPSTLPFPIGDLDPIYRLGCRLGSRGLGCVQRTIYYNIWCLEPTRVLEENPNGIPIGSAVFAGLTTVTDRQTDYPRYMVGIYAVELRCDLKATRKRETCYSETARRFVCVFTRRASR